MDDEDRYREMLQKSLLPEGWEEAFDFRRYREAVLRDRDRMRARAAKVLGDQGASAYETHLMAMVEQFVPRGRYDLPTTEQIFRPLLDAVLDCARALGLPPIRDVELVTSTSITPSPLSRPTTDVHQLFVGLGTSAFCNYWAKAFTAVVMAVGSAGPPHKRIESTEELRVHLSRDPRGLILATRLALYYAATGTLLGFGEVEESPSSYAYRTQLLNAMEVFAVAHEYAHFLAEERGLVFLGDGGEPTNKSLELFCDETGLQITREWASRNENWLAFSGVGAATLFTAIDVSERCAEVLANAFRGKGNSFAVPISPEESSHPSIEERLGHLIKWTIAKSADDQREAVKDFLTEFVVILEGVKISVLDVISQVTSSMDSADPLNGPDSERSVRA